MFIAYNVSLELIRELRTLVPVIARHDRELSVQIRTAASWGWLDEADRARQILDRLLALLWKLTRGRA
jgi:hypothetical protein